MTTINQLRQQQRVAKEVNSNPKLAEIVVKLHKLRNLGHDDKEIETIIKSLDLSFRHLSYIMSNYSAIMALKIELC